MTVARRAQKKKSRTKNDITTIQLSRTLKKRLHLIIKSNGFNKLDEGLDEVLSFYEDNHLAILGMDNETD
ncbi:hypothetical protein CMT41_08885 [Colwellia sp. MT41]|uniref:Uncharacterized protein n=1 Tax=Colwellia marinimaniae TaxID=1513592 RepID=A0ABQ0MVS0_9GAMM|nr:MULTISPECIES: hypothetical protein [Colwellia]ALO34818.1 hypothetical protein CMT41_08885 [Colwellia sp. MT41]GAW96468.1 hypothetical protein MTCD1_02083 [Colwellia marinimaniae]